MSENNDGRPSNLFEVQTVHKINDIDRKLQIYSFNTEKLITDLAATQGLLQKVCNSLVNKGLLEENIYKSSFH